MSTPQAELLKELNAVIETKKDELRSQLQMLRDEKQKYQRQLENLNARIDRLKALVDLTVEVVVKV